MRRVLKVQAPDGAFARSQGVVDLGDGQTKAGLSQLLGAEEAAEETTRVLRALPLDKHRPVKRSWGQAKAGHDT